MPKTYNLKSVASTLKKSQVSVIKIAERVGLSKTRGRWEFTEEQIFALKYEFTRKKDKVQLIVDSTAVGRGMIRSIMNRYQLNIEADYHKILAICSLWKAWDNKSMVIKSEIQ